MKTKAIFCVAGMFATVIATTWLVGCTVNRDEVATPPTENSVVLEPVAPVVVGPSSNFDLEAASPATVDNEPTDAATGIEMPTPELTWYDPHGLECVGGIS